MHVASGKSQRQKKRKAASSDVLCSASALFHTRISPGRCLASLMRELGEQADKIGQMLTQQAAESFSRRYLAGPRASGTRPRERGVERDLFVRKTGISDCQSGLVKIVGFAEVYRSTAVRVTGRTHCLARQSEVKLEREGRQRPEEVVEEVEVEEQAGVRIAG